eukprot:CAMPEP_0174981916 /NCGR_PEP_ID=MMETSP0004_2-20121128/16171_1 /TAXON_ID=420556 /ORGANISM="Ochromonas sp., Strain CCMP1393" /LENGTH=82 /DNA_ID=CAMNT_0016233745 /DNA_START=121 /DNA_END=369 /DNA_ORIENTATION=-
MAKVEAEIMTEMFNKMTITCFKKCVVKHNESELQVGEMTCVDRCVGKYLEAQEKVGGVLNQFEQQMKAMEAAGVPDQRYKPK